MLELFGILGLVIIISVVVLLGFWFGIVLAVSIKEFRFDD
tara:strand:+ start:163 stop:282 length:120 start_codon:yes stop_codon:yes gene_type:complete